MSVNNNLANREAKTGLTAYLTNAAVKEQITKVVGGKNGDRFMSAIISAVQANKDLQQCTNPSILSAALLGESLKLSPSPQLGQYYMVPFNDNKHGIKTAQFLLGYKGYVQLALRSGYYKKLNVMAVKDGELVSFDPLNEEINVHLIEDEEEREKAQTIGYYAMFEYINGFRKAIYWSRSKMEAHALKYSKGYAAKKGYTFWEKDFDAMAYKTMLRQLISKWGIMSIDMTTAYEKDGVVEHEDGTKEYVELETNQVAADPAVESKAEPVEEPDEDTLFA